MASSLSLSGVIRSSLMWLDVVEIPFMYMQPMARGSSSGQLKSASHVMRGDYSISVDR